MFLFRLRNHSSQEDQLKQKDTAAVDLDELSCRSTAAVPGFKLT